MTKKKFFKGLATILLLPGGFLAAAALAMVFAVLVAAWIYVAVSIALVNWIASAGAFAKSFGEADAKKSENEPVAGAPEKLAGLPGDVSPEHKKKVWEERERAHRKWLQ